MTNDDPRHAIEAARGEMPAVQRERRPSRHDAGPVPTGARLSVDVEHKDRASPWRGRVRWWEPDGRRRSLSRSFGTEQRARDWIENVRRTVEVGLTPDVFRILYLAASAGHEAGLIVDEDQPDACRVCGALAALEAFLTDMEVAAR